LAVTFTSLVFFSATQGGATLQCFPHINTELLPLQIDIAVDGMIEAPSSEYLCSQFNRLGTDSPVSGLSFIRFNMPDNRAQHRVFRFLYCLSRIQQRSFRVCYALQYRTVIQHELQGEMGRSASNSGRIFKILECYLFFGHILASDIQERGWFNLGKEIGRADINLKRIKNLYTQET
jgi:hypothetical protein